MGTSTTQTSLGSLTRTFAAHTHLGSIVVSMRTQTGKAVRVDREAQTEIKASIAPPDKHACCCMLPNRRVCMLLDSCA